MTPILEDLLSKDDPDYAGKPDIKWNFTKFLVDREGNVVRRFEPTASIPDVVRPRWRSCCSLFGSHLSRASA